MYTSLRTHSNALTYNYALLTHSTHLDTSHGGTFVMFMKYACLQNMLAHIYLHIVQVIVYIREWK